jgi:hypothetical protein
MSKKNETIAEKKDRLEKQLEPIQLSHKILLDSIQFDPPPSPGRGKRKLSLDEPGGMLRLDIMQSVSDGFISDELQAAMAEGIRSGSKSVFQQITKVMEEIENRNDSQFQRRVIASLRAKIRLRDKLGRLPTKSEVKTEVGRMEGLRNKIELEDFATAEPERWTEIFRAAHLHHLPKGKPQRGKTRRGNK